MWNGCGQHLTFYIQILAKVIPAIDQIFVIWFIVRDSFCNLAYRSANVFIELSFEFSWQKLFPPPYPLIHRSAQVHESLKGIICSCLTRERWERGEISHFLSSDEANLANLQSELEFHHTQSLQLPSALLQKYSFPPSVFCKFNIDYILNYGLRFMRSRRIEEK